MRDKGGAVKNLKLFALLALIVVAAACGGGGGITSPSGPPSPSPSPSAPARFVVRPLEAGFDPGTSGVGVEFVVGVAGILDVWFEVNPGPPQAYVRLYLMPGTIAECRASNCEPVARAEDPTLARQSLQYRVVPGTYAVRIFKVGMPPASGKGEIGLTPDA